MNRFIRLFVAFVILIGMGAGFTYEVEASEKQPAEVKLTTEQQQELEEIYKEMFEKKKEVISKYVEFGVLTEEKGMKITKKMEERYQKLADNGFVYPKEKCKKHKKKH